MPLYSGGLQVGVESGLCFSVAGACGAELFPESGIHGTGGALGEFFQVVTGGQAGCLLREKRAAEQLHVVRVELLRLLQGAGGPGWIALSLVEVGDGEADSEIFGVVRCDLVEDFPGPGIVAGFGQGGSTFLALCFLLGRIGTPGEEESQNEEDERVAFEDCYRHGLYFRPGCGAISSIVHTLG